MQRTLTSQIRLRTRSETTRLTHLPKGPLQRAARIAIATTAAFAIVDHISPIAKSASFAVFGCIAFLLFANLGPGTRRQHAGLHGALVVAGGALLALGTACSGNVWLAAIVGTAVSFAVLLSGLIGPVFAGLTLPMLVSFVIGATVPGPISAIPDRLWAWLIAGAVALVAVVLPAAARPDRALRELAAETSRQLGVFLRHEGNGDEAASTTQADLFSATSGTVARLRSTFYGMQYSPSGLGADGRALIESVQQLVLFGRALDRIAARPGNPLADVAIRPVVLAAANVLEHCATILVATGTSFADLEESLDQLRVAGEAIEAEALSLASGQIAPPPHDDDLLVLLEPGFRAREIVLAVTAIARSTRSSAEMHRRSWWHHLLDRSPLTPPSPGSLNAWIRRSIAHIDRHAVWLQNSVRGSLGLGIAVFVANTSGVDRAFWVAFGTLSVLRSTATNTGQSVLRALAGTIVGSVIGGLLVTLIGSSSPLAWVLFFLALGFSSLAPAVVSFGAGQAGFSVAVIMLFSLVAPISWSISLVRIQDVAIGCGVALLMSLLFWPRGASQALGAALSEAIFESSRYLADSTRFAIAQCDERTNPVADEGRPQPYRATAAARRLDDAFRQFLSERGTKGITLAEITTLVTTTAILREVADDICELWVRPGYVHRADHTAIREAILRFEQPITGWFTDLALSLIGYSRLPIAPDIEDEAELSRAAIIQRDPDPDGHTGGSTSVKLVWTLEYLATVQRLEAGLLRSAQIASSALRPPTGRDMVRGY
ncbi:MAG TPA: FUSC family protein [Thermomicrobiales bacterium]|nr:FUSC family protein [Thermomicrobiales bacterium]